MITLMLALGLSSINLQGTFSPPDFGTFLDGICATLYGVTVAFFCVNTVRRLGSGHVLTRLEQAQLKDIVCLTHSETIPDRDRYLDRSLDRIARVAALLSGSEAEANSEIWLRRLRFGAEVATIRAVSRAFGKICETATGNLMHTIQKDVMLERASPKMLIDIDYALRTVSDEADSLNRTTLLSALVELRLIAFQAFQAGNPQHKVSTDTGSVSHRP